MGELWLRCLCSDWVDFSSKFHFLNTSLPLWDSPTQVPGPTLAERRSRTHPTLAACSFSRDQSLEIFGAQVLQKLRIFPREISPDTSLLSPAAGQSAAIKQKGDAKWSWKCEFWSAFELVCALQLPQTTQGARAERQSHAPGAGNKPGSNKPFKLAGRKSNPSWHQAG